VISFFLTKDFHGREYFGSLVFNLLSVNKIL